MLAGHEKRKGQPDHLASSWEMHLPHSVFGEPSPLPCKEHPCDWAPGRHCKRRAGSWHRCLGAHRLGALAVFQALPEVCQGFASSASSVLIPAQS